MPPGVARTLAAGIQAPELALAVLAAHDAHGGGAARLRRGQQGVRRVKAGQQTGKAGHGLLQRVGQLFRQRVEAGRTGERRTVGSADTALSSGGAVRQKIAEQLRGA